MQFHDEGGVLQPGMLIHAFPPFCTQESGKGVSLKAISAEDLLWFHADFAAQLPADGEQIGIEIVD